MKKDKIKALDLIRAISMLGIVLFHYSYNYIEYEMEGNPLRFNKYPTGDWGGLFVAIFFMISGASLWYNYRDRMHVGRFYLKRWLSIFPMFYLAWFVGYLLKVQELGSWYWGGPRRNFIYTILGVDGFFLNPGFNINYYTLGEWFLGAIIMLYVLFPLFWFLFSKHDKTGIWIRVVTTIALIILYVLNLHRDWFTISDGKNLITCSMNFWMGMLIMEYYPTLKNSGKQAVSEGVLVILMLILGTVRIGLPELMVSTIIGSIVVLLLLHYGEILMENKIVSGIAVKLSGWSYGIFLVHHVILYAFMKRYAGRNVSFIKSIGLFFVVFAIIAAVGAFLSLAGKGMNRLICFLLGKVGIKI